LSAQRDVVVVSAAPGGALTSQIASSLSVVSADEIDDRGAQTALDVLRGLPGTEINQSGGRGTVTSAFIRGGDSDYNLVMIDGIELNDFGGGFDLSPLPAEGVEQIEVIRGPESALYGSNADSGRWSAAFFLFGRSGQLVHLAVGDHRSRIEQGIQLGVQPVAFANQRTNSERRLP
jgi:outer membrane receptor protein involved in Fe transport